MSKTQILTPMLIYFRPLSFFTPRGALTGPRGGESAGSPPGLLNIPTNCILTKDGTFCRMRSLPHIFVAMALHYYFTNLRERNVCKVLRARVCGHGSRSLKAQRKKKYTLAGIFLGGPQTP